MTTLAPQPIQWLEDPYEGFCLRRDPDDEEPDPRSTYERHPLDSSYYEDARFM